MIKRTISVLIVIACMSNLLQAKDNSKANLAGTLKQTDIGNPAIAGKMNITDAGFDITAGGSDIWGKRDEFHFSYKELKGDFDFSAQVISLSKANQYTKAGIMARVDLDDSSQHVYFQIFPDNTPRNKNNGGCEFQYRLEKAGEMKAVYPDPKSAGNKFDVAFPNTWIRLKRSGDVFESYVSNDNKTWRLYTTFTQKMPKELFVGLAVTSHSTTESTTARFGAVELKNNRK
jgi:regulation of enolase protein 1 (concanavalin A-like superfamily)